MNFSLSDLTAKEPVMLPIKCIRNALSKNIPVLVTNWFPDHPTISLDEKGRVYN
jgi:hypothetical protein